MVPLAVHGKAFLVNLSTKLYLLTEFFLTVFFQTVFVGDCGVISCSCYGIPGQLLHQCVHVRDSTAKTAREIRKDFLGKSVKMVLKRCENFRTFFIEYDSLILKNGYYFIVKG